MSGSAGIAGTKPFVEPPASGHLIIQVKNRWNSPIGCIDLPLRGPPSARGPQGRMRIFDHEHGLDTLTRLALAGLRYPLPRCGRGALARGARRAVRTARSGTAAPGLGRRPPPPR